MAVTRLDIENLRCISRAGLDLSADFNLIIGPNGAGKTSVLEAVHVLGRGHSFRVRDNRRLVRDGEAGFVVRCQRVGVDRGHRLAVGYQRGELQVRIDGEAGKRASELAEALPVEVIDPASHRLIDGGPAERRRFLDWGLFHVEPSYIVDWRAYRRVLMQRNQALRAGLSDGELLAWDDALVSSAAKLEVARCRVVDRWTTVIGSIGERLLGSSVHVEYRPGTGQYDSLKNALEASRQRERDRGMTLYGPHRSDLGVRFEGGAAREVASRGQQKLLAASLVLGRLRDRIECYPRGGMLLVDDPAAELDEGALDRLLLELLDLPIQMIVSSIRREAVARLDRGRMFHVEQGVIEAQ